MRAVDLLGKEYEELRPILGNLSVDTLRAMSESVMIKDCQPEKRLLMRAFIHNRLAYAPTTTTTTTTTTIPRATNSASFRSIFARQEHKSSTITSDDTKRAIQVLRERRPLPSSSSNIKYTDYVSNKLRALKKQRSIDNDGDNNTIDVPNTSYTIEENNTCTVVVVADDDDDDDEQEETEVRADVRILEFGSLSTAQIRAQTVPVHGNGACMFASLSLHLCVGSDGDSESARTVRIAIVEWMHANDRYVLEDRREFRDAALADAVAVGHEGSYEEYVNLMADTRTYGGAPELLAASVLYNVHIIVYREDDSTPCVFYAPPLTAAACVVPLLHNNREGGEGHYDGIVSPARAIRLNRRYRAALDERRRYRRNRTPLPYSHDSYASNGNNINPQF